MRKRTHTGATHFSFKVAITQDLNSIISCIDARMTYVHVYTTRSIETMSEARERIKAKAFFFIHAMHPFQLGMAIYAISMRALIFPRLARITSCCAPSATRSGVTPLILRACPNAATRFSLGRPTFCNFHPKSTPETISEGQNNKIFLGGGGHAPRPS